MFAESYIPTNNSKDILFNFIGTKEFNSKDRVGKNGVKDFRFSQALEREIDNAGLTEK